MSIHELRYNKVAEALDYRTDQSGLDGFITDGGAPVEDDVDKEWFADRDHELMAALDYHTQQGNDERVEEILEEKKELRQKDPDYQLQSYM